MALILTVFREKLKILVKVKSDENRSFRRYNTDGHEREESGMIVKKGTPDEDFVVTGMYTVETKRENIDGGYKWKFRVTEYTADKTGYHVKFSVGERGILGVVGTTQSIDSNVIKSLVGK